MLPPPVRVLRQPPGRRLDPLCLDGSVSGTLGCPVPEVTPASHWTDERAGGPVADRDPRPGRAGGGRGGPALRGPGGLSARGTRGALRGSCQRRGPDGRAVGL